MALARITGPISEHAIELIKQLREHGYDTVQNSDINDPTSLVDLEIDLLECSSDEVLNQIQAFGEEDVTVTVASGALDAPILPASEAAVEQKLLVEEAQSTDVVSEAEVLPEISEQIVDAPVFAMDNVAEPEPSEAIEDPPVSQSVNNFEPEAEAVSDAMALAMENTSKVEAAPERAASEVPLEPFADVPPESIHASLMAESVSAIHERAEEPEPEDFDSAFLSENTQEVVAEIRAETEPQLAAEPATGIHAELIHTAQSNEELSDWPIWQVLQEETGYEEKVPDISQSSPEQHRALIRRLQTSCERIMMKPSFRWLGNERLFNRTASATVAIGIALLVLGTVTHRFRPLPSRVEQGTSQARQAAPFQTTAAITASSAASLLQGSTTAANSPAPFAVTKSSNKVESAAQTQTRPAVVRPASDADYVATNTIVRYGSRVARRKITSDANPTGVKYYTDLKPASR